MSITGVNSVGVPGSLKANISFNVKVTDKSMDEGEEGTQSTPCTRQSPGLLTYLVEVSRCSGAAALVRDQLVTLRVLVQSRELAAGKKDYWFCLFTARTEGGTP